MIIIKNTRKLKINKKLSFNDELMKDQEKSNFRHKLKNYKS